MLADIEASRISNRTARRDSAELERILRMVAEAREMRLCEVIAAFPEVPLSEVAGRRVLVISLDEEKAGG